MKSYESCNWVIKVWRSRWYLYAILLHLKNLLVVNYFIELILNKKLEKKDKESLRDKWRYIIRHVELSKMCKYTTKKYKDINLKR